MIVMVVVMVMMVVMMDHPRKGSRWGANRRSCSIPGHLVQHASYCRARLGPYAIHSSAKR
jgi:hypothetical protein